MKIFLIAGEESGDLLGSKIMNELKKRKIDANQKLEFFGVGGERMQKEGLDSIFPMHELSIMGIVEVIPHIPNVLRRIKQTVKNIVDIKPDLILTIDAPDFCFRVIKKLKKNHKEAFDNTKKMHLIAPSVWVYRESRAEKISKLYDHLLAILPFEPPYFEKYSLKTTFIGHPVVETLKKDEVSFSDDELFELRQKLNLPQDKKIICVTPGSRRGEISRLLPIFMEAISLLKEQNIEVNPVIFSTKKMKQFIEEQCKDQDFVAPVISSRTEKNKLMSICDLALTKSGTNTFEFMLMEKPMVVCYKANFITTLIANMIVKIKLFNLANVILGKENIPEMMKEKCKPNLIARQMMKLLGNEELSRAQVTENNKVLDILGRNEKYSSTQRAVDCILGMFK